MIGSDTNLTETGGGGVYRIRYARETGTTATSITSTAVATKLLDAYDTWYPYGRPLELDRIELREQLKLLRPKPSSRPFPAPRYLVAGAQIVAIVAPPVRERRPLRRVTGPRDPRALRASPGRRGVLRRDAEKARAEEDA